MSIDKLNQLISKMAENTSNNEELATPVLSAKLAKCIKSYPYDQTLGAMARVIDKMAENKTFYIKRADFKQLYNKLYSRGTNFANLFEKELGEQVSDKPSIKLYEREQNNSKIEYQVKDQVLASALESVFDKNTPLKLYSKVAGDRAIRSVSSSLDVWSLSPNNLTIADGNDKCIIIKADYETPKGITSFLVPVEVSDNKVIEPEVFVGNSGPLDLNNIEVKAYITQNAGRKMNIAGTDLLKAIDAATSERREITAVDVAVSKLNASRQVSSEFFDNQIVGQKVATAGRADVAIPVSNEFMSLEKTFTGPQGEASYKFGADKVNIAKNHIARELGSFGYNKAQIVVTGSDKSTILCGVSLDSGKVAFTVPVKLENNKLIAPSVILCNGSVASFDKEGILDLMKSNSTDNKIAAFASSMASLKPSEVLRNLRDALADGNHEKAEDALNVLASAGDERVYASGFQIYMNGLANKKSGPTCSKQIKTASSEHPVCSHTGLPVNKIYVDKSGYCRPLYRQGMEDTYEGASFMNAKIFG